MLFIYNYPNHISSILLKGKLHKKKDFALEKKLPSQKPQVKVKDTNITVNYHCLLASPFSCFTKFLAYLEFENR